MRRKLAILVTTVLLGSSMSLPAHAAVKAGAKCTVKGQIKSSKGETFTCAKSGKKLVWKSGLILEVPTIGGKKMPLPTPTSSLVPSITDKQDQFPTISPSSMFASANECKLLKPSNLQMDDGPNGSVGFPKNSNAFPSTGNIRAVVLLVDFPDVIAVENLKKPWLSSSIPNAENFFTHSSYDKFKIKVDLVDKIYRMTKKSTYYELLASPSGGPLPGSPPPKIDEVILDAMDLADPDIDFSKYAFAVVSTPASPNLALSGAAGLGANPRPFDGVTFKYGDLIPLDSLTPLDQPYKTLNFTHDIGHMLGLLHPYKTDGSITGAWDIMWSFAFQRDFLGWNKWKLNWIDNEQVSCINENFNDSVTQLLTPIGDKSEGKKLLIIKLNSTSAIAVEVRRKTPFDDLKPLDEGVIVYSVDTTKSQGQGPYKIVSNTRKTIMYQNRSGILGTMKPGETISELGYAISVLSSSTEGDYVSIKKLN